MYGSPHFLRVFTYGLLREALGRYLSASPLTGVSNSKEYLMPKWHIFGWRILPYKWKESAFCEVGYDCWGPVVWKCYPRNKGDTKLLQLKKKKKEVGEHKASIAGSHEVIDMIRLPYYFS